MEKKTYVKPLVEVIQTAIENLMLVTSPGISNEEFDPHTDEIGAKRNNNFNVDLEEYPHYSLWED